MLTAIGDDRTGLVQSLAEVVTAHGGNWERSEMAELAGKFAGIVLVTVPDDRVDDLRAALGRLADVLDVEAHVGADEVADTRCLSLHLLGNDRPGIVRELSAALASLGIGIDQLTTSTRAAPMAGGVLFEADAVLEAPPELDVGVVRDVLEQLADELMVDIELGP